MTESTPDKSAHDDLRTISWSYTRIALGLLVAFVAGWLIGNAGKDDAITKVRDERDTLLARTETLQDPIVSSHR